MAPRAESTARLSAQITSLEREVRELRQIVERVADHLGTEHKPVQVMRDGDGMFLPGTGHLGPHHEPDPDIPVPFNEAAERAREAREALRQKAGDE